MKPRQLRQQQHQLKIIVDFADCRTDEAKRADTITCVADDAMRLVDEPRQQAVADAHDGHWP